MRTEDLSFYHGTSVTAARSILNEGARDALGEIGSRALGSEISGRTHVGDAFGPVGDRVAVDDAGAGSQQRDGLGDARGKRFVRSFPGRSPACPVCGMSQRVCGDIISAVFTGTHLDIAANDHMRPITTTTAIPIDVRICSPLGRSELRDLGLACSRASGCDADHISFGADARKCLVRSLPGRLRVALDCRACAVVLDDRGIAMPLLQAADVLLGKCYPRDQLVRLCLSHRLSISWKTCSLLDLSP
jgi:hypothetical protein